MFSALRKLVRRVSFWLRRHQHERDLAEEIAEHRRQRGAASVASPALHIESARAVWIPPRITSFIQDLRYGTRQLRHNRMFTFVALSGLAIAIGLNTAVFSIVDAVFWRPMPVKDGDRVVHLLRIGRDDRRGPPFSQAELRHYQESGALESVTGVALDDRLGAEWSSGAAPRVVAAFVAPNFFDMLGAAAIAGRLLDANEKDAVALVTETAWKRRLQKMPDVIGARIVLNEFPFTIVGVVADKSVAIVDTSVEIVLPLGAQELVRLADLKDRLRLIGKLHPSGDLDQAQTALGVVAQRWFAAHPDDTQAYRPLAVPARLATLPQAGGTRNIDLLLATAVVLVLVIACANLTNLLLARAEARRREMAVRLSLGAGRLRLVRQLLTECFLLTGLAALLGLLSANGLLRAALALLPRIVPVDLPVPWLDLGINATIFAFTLGLCAFTTVIFGLAPAIQATRPDVSSTMKDTAPAGRVSGSRIRGFLIAVQMGACVVLLVVTASLNSAMSVLDEFLSTLESQPVVQAQIQPGAYGYSPAASRDLLEKVRDRAMALPEVEAVAMTQWPMVRALIGTKGRELEVEGQPGKTPAPVMEGAISDGCLRVFGLRLTSGRDFTSTESRNGAAVVLINEPLARSLFAGAAVGQRIRYWTNGKPEAWQEIVGIVAEKPIAGETPGSYATLRPLGLAQGGFVQLRTRGDQAAVMLSLRKLIRDLDPRMSATVNSLRAFVEYGRWVPRAVAFASLFISFASLWMAAVGLYGVTSYIAVRRTKEIGIRMALGARPGNVLRMMVSQGSALVAFGTLAGSLCAVGAERVLSSALHLLPPQPIQTYLAIGAFLGAVAFLAMLIPSLRAARLNPVLALRHDG
ncbi:MAG: ABC transporter permease [Bryobacteraceae bacterium]